MQSPNRISDGQGGAKTQWQDQGYIWGEMGAVRGVQTQSDAAGRNFLTTRIGLNDAVGSGIEVGWQLVRGAQIFQIIAIENRAQALTEVRVRYEVSDEL